MLEAAWDVGVRYFDGAPWYGFGLSERRFGHFLHDKNRGEYILSSKVGKLFKASKTNKHAEIFPFSDSPNDVIFVYTDDRVRLSIQDSLQRLGVDSLASRYSDGLNRDLRQRWSHVVEVVFDAPVSWPTANEQAETGAD